MYGLVFMLPALLFMDFRWGFERLADPVNLFNLLFLGVGASAMCFVTWNMAVKLLDKKPDASIVKDLDVAEAHIQDM